MKHLLLFVLVAALPVSQGLRPFFFKVRSTRLHNQYGKGTDIWPPTNEGPIHLADSFPNGEIPPDIAIQTSVPPTVNPLNENEATSTSTNDHSSSSSSSSWKRMFRPRAAIDRILRRAATTEEEKNRPSSTAIDRTPLVVALSLLRFVQPMDVLLVTFLSGYIGLLTQLSSSSSSGNNINKRPTLPGLPPQGHVPQWNANPLGYRISNSVEYDRWLKLGVVTGLFLPYLWIARHCGFVSFFLERSSSAAATATTATAVVSLAARPLFLLCCQAITESLTRYYPTIPLPIRIFVPVSYNTVRLAYLWKWAVVVPSLGTFGRTLAVANLAYWFINLFGFLLPVAVMKYMRAHFFCVEAEQVTTRAGMEETLGLSSPSATTYYYQEE